MNNEIFAEEIKKTGFVLENSTAQILRKNGWTVISNKYYVDDSEEAVREIDLLAYRVRKVQHFDVFTVLIISCKKSEADAWALLSREANHKDPNSDWWPLHCWSNDKALQFQLSKEETPKRFHDSAQANGVNDALTLPDVEVFAFQQMNKISGKPQNQTAIYSAITSLMKAQAYELSALPKRKKAPCVYQFNLLSVLDTDLVRLMFKNDEIKPTSIYTEHFLTRYIINKKEIFSRIRFIRSNIFSKVLKDYDRLHTSNSKWFAIECDSFYRDIVKDWKKVESLELVFKSEIDLMIKWRLDHFFQKEVLIGDPSLFWSDSDKSLHIGFDTSDDVLSYLNVNDQIKGLVEKALRKIFRYEGPFVFTYDIPF